MTPREELKKFTNDFIDDYELCDAEDEAGNSGDYMPTEHERMLITDCVNGLLADEEFCDLVVAARLAEREQRRAEGRCETCGAPAEVGHWGGCRAAAKAQADLLICVDPQCTKFPSHEGPHSFPDLFESTKDTTR